MKIKSLNLLFNVAVAVMALSLFGCKDNAENTTPQHNNTSFDFSGKTIDHRSIKLNILPKDKEQEYIVFLSEKKHFTVNNIDTREELLEDDYIYFTQLAEEYEMGVRDFLSKVGWLVKGDKMGYGAVNLYPDTEYVVYCYGVTFDGDYFDATTSIDYIEIKTTAPKNVSVDFAIETNVAGNVASVSIDPKAYDGYYYSVIVPETDSFYLYDNMEFSKEYMEHYRNTLLKEFDKSETSVAELCHKGKVVYSERLEPNKEHVLLVFAISGDDAPIISSKPAIARFNTQNVKTSDLIIDIAVTDITPYDAYLTVTPSNDEESYACLLLAKNQVPPIDNEYEQMLRILEYYEPEIIKGKYSEKILPFMPNSEYVILAFGMENDLPTTQIFRHDFTTADATESKVTIESIELLKLFDVEEIISLDSSYDYLRDVCGCIGIVEMKTSAPTDKVYFWFFEEWMKIEYSDEAFLEDLLMYDATSTVTMMNMYYSLDESDKFFFAGIAEDEDGNLSPLYYGESFLTSKDMCSPAKEFFDYVGTRSTDHHLVMVR